MFVKCRQKKRPNRPFFLSVNGFCIVIKDRLKIALAKREKLAGLKERKGTFGGIVERLALAGLAVFIRG